MSKKCKKGKTIPLTDFLASGPKLVTVRDSTWASIVDEEEAQKKPIVVDMSGLPTAPRSAVDIDYSTVPNNPPYFAHVANLSFEIDDEGLRRIFGDLKPKVARIIREGNRSRGVGLVQFETRENLIEALKRTDKEIYGRKIRVNISGKTDFQHLGNRTNDERPEISDRWKRIERKSDETFHDRQRFGSGYSRTKQHHRFNNDDDKSKNFDRFSNTHDSFDQNSTNDNNREIPKERPRLNLQPRTKPFEKVQISQTEDLTNNSDQISSEQTKINSSRGAGASIFGGAKPVDTTAKEFEIERKLEKLHMTQNETEGDEIEKRTSSRQFYTRTHEREHFRSKRSSQNDGRSGHDSDYHHKREFSGGRRYEDDSRKFTNEDFNRRDRFNNSSRRDFQSGRNNNFSVESQIKTQQRGNARPNVENEDDSHKLHLSNKFCMLDDDDSQSQTFDE